MLDAGSLQYRIYIQRPIKSDDPITNQANTTFEDERKVWAAINPASAIEVLRAKQVNKDVTHTFRIRYFAGLTTAHRIRWGTRFYNITGNIDPTSKHEEWRVSACEVTYA